MEDYFTEVIPAMGFVQASSYTVALIGGNQFVVEFLSKVCLDVKWNTLSSYVLYGAPRFLGKKQCIEGALSLQFFGMRSAFSCHSKPAHCPIQFDTPLMYIHVCILDGAWIATSIPTTRML